MTTPSQSPAEIQRLLDEFELRTNPQVQTGLEDLFLVKEGPKILAYVRTLEKEHHEAKAALLNLSAAWVVEGKYPAYHKGWQETIAKEWPVLHAAILRCYQVFYSLTLPTTLARVLYLSALAIVFPLLTGCSSEASPWTDYSTCMAATRNWKVCTDYHPTAPPAHGPYCPTRQEYENRKAGGCLYPPYYPYRP